MTRDRFMNTGSRVSGLDRPEVTSRLFHPRRELPRSGPPTGCEDLLIPVDGGTVIGARFHPCGRGATNLLLFHGNGEIAADYDDLAVHFNRAGVNFLPADYRGYGRSTGSPSATALLGDAHAVLRFTRSWLTDSGFPGPILVAGRSLGSAPALDVASVHGHPDVAGIVIDSGFAATLPLLETLGLPVVTLGLGESDGFHNLDKIRTYTGPTVIIHGAQDDLIPVENARELFEASTAEDKNLLIIPEADHNSVFLFGLRDYMAAVAELARKTQASKTGYPR